MDNINLKSLKVEDLAGIYSEVAQQIGMENAYKLYLYFKGQQLSFPLKFVSREFVARQIRKEYDGNNIRSLARKYEYTEGRVRQIIRKLEM